jgi:hypothetical protein
MSLRPLSASERADALNKAAAARAARAAAKERLKNGETSAADIISSAAQDEALPGIGKVRAAAIMEQLGIAASRRVRGLGIHQRQALVDFIDEK